MHATKTKDTKKRAIIYVRVSDDGQINGTSLDDQAQRCTRALEDEQIEVVRLFREEGESAKSADRKGLMEAVQFCLHKKNHIDVFMVWKVDRFARRTEDHFAIRRVLRNAGIELRSATEPIGDDPNSKLFEVMVAGFAEFDNDIRRIRCTNGMRARIRSGIWPFKAPLGYRNRSLARQSIKKTEPDPADPVVFPILQRALKGFASGAYTQMDMVHELVKADFKTLTGVEPTIQFVDHLLTRQLAFYAGWLRDSLGEAVEYHRGRHEPMISDEERRRIEFIRDGGDRAGIARDRHNPLFPLRRLVRCAECGHLLTGSSPRGRRASYPYYHCYNRDCPLRSRTIPKQDIEQHFRELMDRLRPRQGFLAILTKLVAGCADEQRKLDAAMRQSHEETLRVLTARRRRIFEMAESGAYDPAQVRERLEDVERDMVDLKLKHESKDAQPGDAATTVEGAKAAIHRVMTGWFDLKPALRARFQKIIFPEGIPYVRGKGFGTAKVGRIFELNQSFEAADSDAVDRMRLSWNQIIDELRQFAELAPLLDDDQATLSGMSNTKSLKSPKSPKSLQPRNLAVPPPRRKRAKSPEQGLGALPTLSA
ncbi:MAG TPA: recombinase family protein [Caulobacteraceae bacterium]|jgi:DNA invertase Pin-like site-specific DNA recombinase